MKNIPSIQELSGEIDDLFNAIRSDAMQTAKDFQAMRALCATESEWAAFWQHNAPTDDPCSLERANQLIKCAERFGDKPVSAWTQEEIEELDHAFWYD